MKHTSFALFIALILLTSCAPASTATPIVSATATAVAVIMPTAQPTETATVTVTPTQTQAPTNTPTPTLLTTITLTPFPTIPLASLQGVPYPEATLLATAIEPYAKTMQLDAGKVQVSYKDLLDYQRKPFAVAIDSATKIPLLITVQDRVSGKPIWQVATLRNLADTRGLKIGVTITISYVQSWNKESAQMGRMITSNFNQFQIGYDLMWWNSDFPENSLRPSANSFNFKQPDLAVAFATKNNMRIEGTGLIIQIPEFLPPWLKNLNSSDSNYKNELLSIMENDIKTTVTKYPQVGNWTVISEIENPYYQNIWTAAFGLGDLTWLQKTFQWAHEGNPNAKLSYSDFDIEFGGTKADRVFSIIKALKDKGTPIDTVTFQMHLIGKDFTKEEDLQTKVKALKAEIARYKQIGIDVIIGEWDIDMGSVSDNPGERVRLHTKIYESITTALLEAGVTSIDFFGPPDRLNWKEDPRYGSGANAYPTLFADDYSPKPAYYAILRVLAEQRQ